MPPEAVRRGADGTRVRPRTVDELAELLRDRRGDKREEPQAAPEAQRRARSGAAAQLAALEAVEAKIAEEKKALAALEEQAKQLGYTSKAKSKPLPANLEALVEKAVEKVLEDAHYKG